MAEKVGGAHWTFLSPQYAKSCLQHDTTISDALTWKGFVSVYDHFVDMETKQVSVPHCQQYRVSKGL